MKHFHQAVLAQAYMHRPIALMTNYNYNESECAHAQRRKLVNNTIIIIMNESVRMRREGS